VNATSAGSPRYLLFRCTLSEVRLTTEDGAEIAELLESDDFLRRMAYSVSGGPYGMVLDQRPFVRVAGWKPEAPWVALSDSQWAMLRKCSVNHLPGSKRRGKK
jgi:hypothetical protein